jgi:mono-ADP-ribosyltransferase sirtuin 6
MKNYNDRLKPIKYKGLCGDDEYTETMANLKEKISELASMIEKSKYTIVFTGAGISTNAGIPDFRGPQGVWTLEKYEKKRKFCDVGVEVNNQQFDNVNNINNNAANLNTTSNENANETAIATTSTKITTVNFEEAQPTVTHHAIAALLRKNKIQHVISQNVDGLHLKSGIEADRLSELHGNIYIEKCEKCQLQYFREKDVGGMGLNYTGF